MGKESINDISSEVLAAFLDGNASASEARDILDAFMDDAQLREILQVSHAVDAELGQLHQDCEFLPMAALAATCEEESYCSMECEKYILMRLNISFDESELLQNALHNGWQKENGTALHNVGRHLENAGLVVTRRYKSSLNDLAEALADDESVMVAVDGGELLGNESEEAAEDMLVGQIPDHTVVVLSYDVQNEVITIFDPNSSNAEDTYPAEQFLDAWNDSRNYMVTAVVQDRYSYEPEPIDLSDVELEDDLIELREAIAENAHEVWAFERKAQGWTYGPQRDDQKKETPCMVAYSQLPESEKKYDRDMAMNTIKLLKKLGYDLVKR